MSKREILEQIDREVTSCVECRLYKRRRHAVPGDGNINAEIMFVGEAPGRQEDAEGVPFVGQAGQLFDRFLADIGISRQNVYVTNVVKCRPPGNRDPRADEISVCTELYLSRQVGVIRPKFLVMLGRHSASYVLSEVGMDVKGITQIHGEICEVAPFGFPVLALPMLHPAAALYQAKYKELLENDFAVLKSRLGK
jgi:uracil-DNA glycosylase family 4